VSDPVVIIIIIIVTSLSPYDVGLNDLFAEPSTTRLTTHHDEALPRSVWPPGSLKFSSTIDLSVGWFQPSISQTLWIELIFATFACSIFLLIWFLMLRDVKVSEELVSHVFNLRVIIARFQAALSLMLGFYTSTIYGRWWAIRDVEGVVIGRINDLAPQIAGLIRDNPPPSTVNLQNHDTTQNVGGTPSSSSTVHDSSSTQGCGSVLPDSHDEVTDAAEVHLHLVRWLNLAHALAVGDLFEKKPNEFSSLQSLVALCCTLCLVH
jgi:hypothetical protein